MFVFRLGFILAWIICVASQEDGTYHKEWSIETNENKTKHNISIVGNQFILDGKPLRIVSGSLHYFRLPAEYWRDRLKKLKAAGLNSVSTYVEWSYHEPEEQQYSFEGDRDVAQFVRTAAEEGLHVLLRPGPYICAERDLGGLPYWLYSKYPKIKLRTTDKDFINETKIWMNVLFERLTPLLYGNGGPVILVQVENEYGSFGSDKVYMGQIRDILREHVGVNAILYTTDGASPGYYVPGSINGTLTTIDFGPGTDVKAAFKDLSNFMPNAPLMNSEFYAGWLTHWGEGGMAKVDKDAVVNTLREILDHKANLNFYMFYGGTSFEFYAGANGDYSPDVTTYDYDAPITESGDLTPKYDLIRKTLIEYYPDTAKIPLPEPTSKGNYGKVPVKACVSLLSEDGRARLGKQYASTRGASLPTFEQLRQRAGLVLYETALTDADGTLTIDKPSDRVYVFVDGTFQGIIDRMKKYTKLDLKSKPGSHLALLVENQGRRGYGDLYDLKGILSPVTYKDKMLNGTWNVTGYPLKPENSSCAIETNDIQLGSGPVLYNGNFTLPDNYSTPLETFINPTGWGKGYVWVNGHNLGRYWPALGPQVTLYVPGVWLRASPAHNTLQVLELEHAPDELTMEFIDHPILH